MGRWRINGEKPRKHGVIFCASSARQRTSRDRGVGVGEDSGGWRREGGKIGSSVLRQLPRVRLRRGKPMCAVRSGVCPKFCMSSTDPYSRDPFVIEMLCHSSPWFDNNKITNLITVVCSWIR